MSEVQVEKLEGRVGLVLLNRPARRNALSISLRKGVADAVQALDADDDIRAIVIGGDERAFAAGADLGELADMVPLDPRFEDLAVMRRACDACGKPLIAAVRGYALGGGCELAMMCDLVVAGQGAIFAQPEVRVGIMPGAGGTQRFLRAAGKVRALRWLLTGEAFTAAQAEAMGIVSEVVPDDQVMERSVVLARKIAAQPAKAVTAIREAIRAGDNAPLETALMIENRLFQMLFATADQREGMGAFLEKREPSFTGK